MALYEVARRSIPDVVRPSCPPFLIGPRKGCWAITLASLTYYYFVFEKEVSVLMLSEYPGLWYLTQHAVQML
jgi:hypothetical protein